MDKDAIKYLVEDCKETEIFEIDGKNYSSRGLHEVEEPMATEISVCTLSGFMDFVNDFCKNRADGYPIIKINSPTKVVLISRLFGPFKQRETFISCTPDLPHITFGHFMDGESFNIMLQSMFVDEYDRKDVLKLAGNVKEENVKSTRDDGISQEVVAKAGIARVENVTVPNPVTLSPYRTFVEIEQPESPFVFRMADGPRFALFEADGGWWRNLAMIRIKDYISGALDAELQGQVLIIS